MLSSAQTLRSYYTEVTGIIFARITISVVAIRIIIWCAFGKFMPSWIDVLANLISKQAQKQYYANHGLTYSLISEQVQKNNIMRPLNICSLHFHKKLILMRSRLGNIIGARGHIGGAAKS